MSHDAAETWTGIGGFVDSSQFRNFDRNELLDVMVGTEIELGSLKAGQRVIGEMMSMVTTSEDFQSWDSCEAFGDVGNLVATISSIIQMLEDLNREVCIVHGDKYPPERPF